MKATKTWKTGDGTQIPIDKLENAHLLRILNGGFADGDTFLDLLEEARKRGLNTSEAIMGYDGPCPINEF